MQVLDARKRKKLLETSLPKTKVFVHTTPGPSTPHTTAPQLLYHHMHSEGVLPSTIRQLLLQHTLLPLISVQSTRNADALFQSECGDHLISSLLVLRPYGNNARYSVPNQSYRIANLQLITRTYGLFPVRFDAPLSDLLNVHSRSDDKIGPLFSISGLEQLLRHLSRAAHGNSRVDLYSDMFRKVVSSNRVVSFDTLNHPVAHLFVVDYATDSIETIRRLLVEFRNNTFPQYFQISDVLFHAFIVFDSRTVAESVIRRFQEDLRSALALESSALPMFQEHDPELPHVRMSKFENSTVDEQAQHLAFSHASDNSELRIPKTLDQTLRLKIFEFLSRILIPYMEQKIRLWDDLILLPKKSITGRLFSVSRKLFNNSENSTTGTNPTSYNHRLHYYHRSSPEQVIRKLADWSLMLKDFKYAYSAYDLIKKDYTNDKAWAYVASTQEMCIVSLLLAQTQPPASDALPVAPDKNTLRKIKHDIIEPYIDNLTYTFKLRFNVRADAVRSYLIVAELLLHMSSMFSIPWWWDDLVESYFLHAAGDMTDHLLGAGEPGPYVIQALIYGRLGYAKALSHHVPLEASEIIGQLMRDGIQSGVLGPAEEGAYRNEGKILPQNDNAVLGRTRFRKSALWYLMAMWDWRDLDNVAQVAKIMPQLGVRFKVDGKSEEWYDRDGLALAKFKSLIEEAALRNERTGD